MIHIRACWYANGSRRAANSASIILRQDMQRNLEREVDLVRRLNTTKREARLIQSANYRQNGGN